MSYFLNLSSDDRKSNENTDKFTVIFNPQIPISGNWECAVETIGIWYSWYNISAGYQNNTFRYYNGTAWKNITIPNGLYSIENLNTYVQSQMKANGDYAVVLGIDTFSINLSPNYNTFKLDIFLTNSYQVDLTVGMLYVIFGFASKIVTVSESGTSNINITNNVDKILISVDVITGGYRGPTNSNIIYSFQADGEPSSLLTIRPYHLVYLPLNISNSLTQLTVEIIDQRGRRVDLNGESVNISLVLKKLY